MQHQLDQINIRRGIDIAAIAVASAATVVGIVTITVGAVAVSIFPETGYQILIGGIIETVGGAGITSVAAIDLVAQNNKYNEVVNQLATDQAQVAALEVIYRQFSSFVNSSQSVSQTITTVSDLGKG